MDFESVEYVQKLFNQIDIEDEPRSEKNDTFSVGLVECYYKPKLRYIRKNHLDFEQYIKENCHNKIQILNRETFHHIKRPVFIFFNHFRVKCAYHNKELDTLYQLALKYGDRIEFIAADMTDMDIMYPGSNPMKFFCSLLRSEDETPKTYAIDAKKRIYEHFDAYKTVENLMEVCENLLNGNLFPSQPLPANNGRKLVKICVHHNYEEIILKSSKNIFLIINLDQYQQHEPNYEKVALTLKDYNLDIVYMEAEKNYIPFEYHANGYPTILFIPFNDKNNFIYYEGLREENLVIKFLKSVMENREVLLLKQQECKSRISQKIVNVPNDFQMDFIDLPQFFQRNFGIRFKVLDRQMLEKSKRIFIIIFMDFSDMKCSAYHIHWLNKLYQLVESSHSCQFFVADFNDIDVINTKWKPCEIKYSAQGKPRIYAIDYLKYTYEYGNFGSAADLLYFVESVIYGQLYYSQDYPKNNFSEKVKVWTADSFNRFLKSCKKHIFITFYSSDDENAAQILKLLETIADDAAELNVEIAKFDVELNYVDLEYAQHSYPVHYFIQRNNKKLSTVYIDRNFDKYQMLDFIISNL